MTCPKENKPRPPNWSGLMKAGERIEKAEQYYHQLAQSFGFSRPSVYVHASGQEVSVRINVNEKVFRDSRGRRLYESFNADHHRRIVELLTDAANYKKYRKK